MILNSFILILIGHYIQLMNDGTFNRKMNFMDSELLTKSLAKCFQIHGFAFFILGRSMLYQYFVHMIVNNALRAHIIVVIILDLVLAISINTLLRKKSLSDSLVLETLIFATLGLMAYDMGRNIAYSVIVMR